MRIGNCILLIPEGREFGSGHVALQHGQQYTLSLRNCWTDRDADVEVSIDGKSIGEYRVERNQTVILERSSSDPGRFTFFKAESKEGEAAGKQEIPVENRGVVTARFRPGLSIKPIKKITRGAGGQSAGGDLWRQTFSKGGGEGTTPTSVELQSSLRSENTVRTCGMMGFAPASDQVEAGITGLTGKSNQTFVTVANLVYDPEQEVTIHLRLVAETEPSVRKLVGNSNPVPAAIG